MHPAQPYLNALARKLGTSLTASESGEVRFEIGRRTVMLAWAESPDRFLIYADAGRIGTFRREDVLMRLLSANFLMHETEGAALSFDSTQNTVGLNGTIQVYGLSPEDFVKAFERFMALTALWRRKLARANRDAEEKAAELGNRPPEESEPNGRETGFVSGLSDADRYLYDINRGLMIAV